MLIIARNTKDLAKKIRKQRKKFKITQGELAKMVECSPITISTWERGVSDIGTNILIKIIIALSKREPLSIATSKDIVE